MIDVHAPVTGPPDARRRRWWVPFLVLVMVAFSAGAVLGGRHDRHVRTPPRVIPASAAAVATTVAPPVPAPVTPADVLRMPGPVPTRASGRFGYAPGTGRVLGSRGGLKRYHVAVERGSGESVAGFAAQVDATLGDVRSWIGSRQLRLQRVPQSSAADFTVYLATRTTAGAMCEQGGTNVEVGGVPYTSCRTPGRAIINLDRWRLSAPTYVKAKVRLSVYRAYVINHEVGHELGHDHEGCPERGGPAPVMVQQTLTLRGCTPNAWPRVRGKQLSGPPV